MSTGDGMKSITASSMRCTPLFLNAVPHSIGWISLAIVRVAQAALISSSVSSPASRYLFISSSLDFGRGLDHLLAPFFADVDAARPGSRRTSNFMPWDASSQMIAFILTQVDHAGEVLFGADRHHDRHRVGLQAHLHLVVDLEEVRAGAVHLVDEREARHLVLVGLAPDGFRLRLHAAHGAVHHARAVEHAHRALDFDREVDVARGVDDVDAVLRDSCRAMPFQKQVVAADVIVMPRSCSCSIQSMVAAPSCTSPILWFTPV